MEAKKPKILIVDDKIENLLTLEAVLGDLDVDFDQALSGEEALSLVFDADYALAIIDIQMPEMDGFETVSYIRKLKKTRNLPIIFVSAIYKEEYHVRKGIETGAVDFMVKPLQPEILKGKVKIFLELYNYRRQLEQMVEDRTAELQQTNEQLRQEKDRAESATRTKSAFLANMSHEIRTPLNGVVGMLGILEGTSLDENQKELVSTIRVSSDSLLGIINDILDFSKIESGQIALEHIDFDLKQLLSEIERILKLKADEKSLELKIETDPLLPLYFNGDSFRIKQVLLNLTSNAVKFTSKGSVRIKVDMLAKEGNKVRLRFSVIDTGIGISEENRKKLFREFSQADSSTARKFGGSGLGLAISRNLIHLMDGRIDVVSKEGEGSEFWFEIMLPEGAKPEERRAAADPSVFGSLKDAGLKVLLAEDNQINQKVALYSLRKLGLSCDLAENGKQAVERYMAKAYDFILMDIQMPVMDGYEATRKIRQFEKEDKRNAVRIVAMTANALKSDRDKCLSVGMDDYISKPFQITELIRIFST